MEISSLKFTQYLNVVMLSLQEVCHSLTFMYCNVNNYASIETLVLLKHVEYI